MHKSHAARMLESADLSPPEPKHFTVAHFWHLGPGFGFKIPADLTFGRPLGLHVDA
jgi:hypothetical protein